MLTRRQFLAAGGTMLGAAALGGGLLWRQRAAAHATPPAAAPGAAATPAVGAAPPQPTIVALLSDTHVRGKDDPFYKQFLGKLNAAIDDLRPEQPGHWLVNGDLTEQGMAAEYAGFHAAMDRVARSGNLMVTTGNHEFYDGALNDKSVTDAEELRRFRSAFGLGQNYNNYVVGGVHFVLLADEQWMGAPAHKDWAWLTPAQLTWFEQVLNAHRDLPTAVFMHQPLNETVVASQGANAFGGSGQAKELRALLARHRQIRLWFSGHTHQRLEAPGQHVAQGHTHFIALGSTAFLNAQTSGGFHRSYDMSQSRLLYIYPDQLVVKGRDHQTKQWLNDLDVSVPRA